MSHFYKICCFCLSLLALTACSNAVYDNLKLAENSLNDLSHRISEQQVPNTRILNQYASILSKMKPELKPLIDQIATDATIQGPLFSNLKTRFERVRDKEELFQNDDERIQELQSIIEATDPVIFDDALSDPINVLADMSDGKLPRINAISKQKSLKENQAQDFGAGSQFIGNPNYGHWQTGSNGLSFWEWYGMYAMFDNLTGGRRYYHNDWLLHRDYSYYNDYGRSRYSSPQQRKTYSQQVEKAKKQFSSSDRKVSSFSKPRTGSSNISSRSKVSTGSSSRYSSSYNSSASGSSGKKTSSYSSTSSFRNSSSYTSRGVSRGK